MMMVSEALARRDLGRSMLPTPVYLIRVEIRGSSIGGGVWFTHRGPLTFDNFNGGSCCRWKREKRAEQRREQVLMSYGMPGADDG